MYFFRGFVPVRPAGFRRDEAAELAARLHRHADFDRIAVRPETRSFDIYDVGPRVFFHDNVLDVATRRYQEITAAPTPT
jgi:hypothetical protein